jgi:hypothetical protein
LELILKVGGKERKFIIVRVPIGRHPFRESTPVARFSIEGIKKTTWNHKLGL